MRNRPQKPVNGTKKPKEIVLYVRMTPIQEKALIKLEAKYAKKGLPYSRQALVLSLIEQAAAS